MLLRGGSSQDNHLDRTLHSLFDEQVERSPDAVALVEPRAAQSITYGELQRMSLRLHAVLHPLAEGAPVGLFMPRSWQYVVAYVAALRTSSYMPLDVALPAALLKEFCERSGCRVVLTTAAVAAQFVQPEGVTLLDVDQVLSGVAPSSEVPPQVVDPACESYVVFSSGTTGKPKCIRCPHVGAVNSYYSRFKLAPHESPERVAVGVFFVWELMRPLLVGSATYVIPDDELYDPEALARFLEENKITRVLLTPTLASVVLGAIAELPALGVLILNGEVLTKHLFLQVRRRLPQCKILNNYSISECAGVATLDMSLCKEDPQWDVAPVGPLMDGVLGWIHPETSELYVGGPNLMIGYASERLNRERFYQHPKYGRMYKTGDLAGPFRGNPKWITISGRMIRNSMQKVRGYSVELGDLEAKLAQHPSVSGTACVVSGEMLSKRLIAYVVLTAPTAAHELIEFLQERVPFYAVPQLFVQLEVLPVHPASSKCDKSKLPPIDTVLPELILSHNCVEPETDTERELLALWQTVLGAGRFGVTDAFDDVGGHSLMWASLYGHVTKRWPHCNVTLPLLHGCPTIRRQAAMLLQGAGGKVDASALHRMQEDARWRLPVAPAVFSGGGGGVGFRQILLTGATGYLGSHLLKELRTRHPEAVIHCLVRDASAQLPGHARKVVGDLSAQWWTEELASSVDVVYHCAAFVDFSRSYEDVRGANVLGTQNILRFCAESKPKALLFISSTGAFPPGTERIEGSAVPQLTPELLTGYAQSKAVAELIVREAAEDGLRVCIARAGDMVGGRESPNMRHDLMRLMLGSLQLQRAPVSDKVLQLADVEAVARWCAGNQRQFNGECCNLVGKVDERLELNAVFEWMRPLGFPIHSCTWTRWVKLVQGGPTNAYYSLYPMSESFFGTNDAPFVETADLEQFTWSSMLLRSLHFFARQDLIPSPNPIFGHVAMVTGASSGIGAACCHSLASRGALLLLCARRQERLAELQEHFGGSCVTHVVDVRNQEQQRDAVLAAIEAFGHPPRILVASAGIMPCTMMANGLVDSWTSCVDVNVNGVLLSVGAVLPGMLDAGSGHIVFISSNAGRTGFQGLAAYSGSKFALEGIGQAMRGELYAKGVRVCSVQPGDVATELLSHDQPGDKEGLAPIIDAIEGTPKILEPADVARAVLFALESPNHVGINEILIEPSGKK